MRQDKWRSPSLGKDMAIRIYGDGGTPVIGFPTRGQQSDQWENFGMTDAIAKQLNNGYNQLFCVDTVDKESLLNKNVNPAKRLMRHKQYQAYILEEVLPYVQKHNSIDYLMLAGVDLGGYHAINLALKHPQKFDKVIGISGVYNIRSFFDDYYDDDIYYNNPIDFVPNINQQKLLNSIMGIDFRLVSFNDDNRRSHARKLAQIFHSKFIQHQLDVWDLDSDDEWDLWRQMLSTHII